MQKNLYQVQLSAVKYRFSFRTLSDRNMKMGCHAILFLQRLNLVPRGYIIYIEHTVSKQFRVIRPKICGNFQSTKDFITQETRRQKAKISGKGYIFQSIVLLISVSTLTSGISIHTTTNVSLMLSVAI